MQGAIQTVRALFAPRREYWLYHGQILLGTLFVKYTGEARAFDSARRSVGQFPTLKAATAAITHAPRVAALEVAA